MHMNLEKALCLLGICISRPEARKLIRQGMIQVDGLKIVSKEEKCLLLVDPEKQKIEKTKNRKNKKGRVDIFHVIPSLQYLWSSTPKI